MNYGEKVKHMKIQNDHMGISCLQQTINLNKKHVQFDLNVCGHE